MLIISVEIMIKIDERERCDTRCVVMRWGNSELMFSMFLDLMFSMLLWKEFQLLQILNDLSIRHLIKLILYENDVKLLKFKRSPVWVDLWYVWSLRIWLLIPELNTSTKAMEWLICFSYRKFNVRMPNI